MRKNSRSRIRNFTRQTVLRSPAIHRANYPRQLHPPFRAVSRRSRIYRRGSSGDEPGFLVGRISKLSFHPRKTMFCEVRRGGRRKGAGKERVRSRVYLPLYVARESRKKFFSTISFALRQFRPSAAREKRIPRERDGILARNATRCFSNIDVAILSPAPSSLPSTHSFLFSLFRPPFYFSASFYDSNSLDRIFAMFHPSNFDHHLPPPSTRPFPPYYFSSFFQPLPPEYSSPFRS